MLSKIDILKELGKGINIYPFILENFKENSINLCAGCYAWTLDTGKVYSNESKDKFSLSESEEFCVKYEFQKFQKPIIKDDENEKYIILLPQSTTLIETEEVLATGTNIGGTYHSKVGIVSQGIGHIGTMLGPNFSGHSLIAFHNIKKDLVVLKVGESFVSVVFHYLDTPLYEKNPTVSGHVEKMSELGIDLSSVERKYLSEDWKCKLEEVRKKMISSQVFKDFKKDIQEQKFKNTMIYFNKKNIIKVAVLVGIAYALMLVSYKLDNKFNTTDWSNRGWNILGSGILVTILSGFLKSFKKI